MTLVDRVADRLADEVRAERPAAEAVPLEQRAPVLHVPGSARAAATSKWSPQQASSRPSKPQPAARAGELGERQVGPLAGEERDGPRHRSKHKLREL